LFELEMAIELVFSCKYVEAKEAVEAGSKPKVSWLVLEEY
jgi:hypothetical protein